MVKKCKGLSNKHTYMHVHYILEWSRKNSINSFVLNIECVLSDFYSLFYSTKLYTSCIVSRKMCKLLMVVLWSSLSFKKASKDPVFWYIFKNKKKQMYFKVNRYSIYCFFFSFWWGGKIFNTFLNFVNKMHKNNKYAKVIKNGSKIEYKKTVFSFAKK